MGRTLWVALIVLVSLVCGCGGSPETLEIPGWTLQVGNDAQRTPISLPLHINDRLPRERSVFTLQTTVPLTPALRGHDLVFAIPQLAAKVSLRAGGKPVVQFDEEPPSAYRGRGPHAWRIPRALTESPSLALELEVAHNWTRSGWLDTVPRLTTDESGDAGYLWARWANNIGGVLALATLLPFGLLHFVTYLFDRRRTRNVWFAVLTLCSSLYPAFTLGYTQYIFGPHELAVLVVASAGAVMAGFCFTRTLFDTPRPLRVFGTLITLLAVIAAVKSGPFSVSPMVPIAGAAATFFASGYHIATGGLIFRKRPRWNNRLLVPGWMVITGVGLLDGGPYLGLGEPLNGVRLVCWGLAVVGLLQSVALSRNFTVSLNEADTLNVELAKRIALLETRQSEIQHLNDELRHQIAGRSRQLSAAFTRMASGTSETTTDLSPGDVIEKRYQVIRVIGVGGMGSVYQVLRVTDGRRLALKVLNKTSGGMEVARFAREAQIASSVDHPNVVGIVDVDVEASGYVYLVMEFVEGVSLAEMRPRFGDVPWALKILRQIAEGLSALHAKGVVHRDLKPGNVLVNEGAGGIPLVKISDFGISSLGDSSGVSSTASDDPSTLRLLSAEELLPADDISAVTPLTRTGMVMGTPVYMAPELAFGAKSAQPASDMFSLGVIAFELLTGRRPFVEPLAVSVLRGISNPDAPARLTTLVPSLDPAVAALIDRALDIAPDARGSASELARALTERQAQSG